MDIDYSAPTQQVLSTGTEAFHQNWFKQNILLLPISTAFVLTLIQLAHIAVTSTKARRAGATPQHEEESSTHYKNDSGDRVILIFSCARLLACLSLLVLSIITLASRADGQGWVAVLQTPDAWMAVTYLYASFLSGASLISSGRIVHAGRYNNILLLTTFVVYAYRDLWPFAKYNGKPQDAAEGTILWAKLGLLAFATLFVPLFVSRRYVPVDPKEPMPTPNPEQTCSIFTRFIFSYMSPVVWAAYRVEHLEVDDMPPLMDSDMSKNLVKHAFPHIDPYSGAKRRHIFFGLMRIFRSEFLVMATALIIISAANYLTPLAIFQVLKYLELGPAYDQFRPWFWALMVFISSISRTVSYTNYHFYATRVLAHAESILTQLIYEHSLRVRLAASDSGSNDDPAQSNKSNGGNLIGHINTLITVDLANITGARDFLFLVLAVPLQILLSILFLFKVLGWSALVGVACLVVLLPVPGYTTKLLHDVQKRKMTLTNARIQKVTEVISVLRMIKLFGWEKKMAEQINGARKDELAAAVKQKVMSTLIGLCNSQLPTISMIVTYATYAGFLKKKLDAAIIFSSLTAFKTLSIQLYEISNHLGQATQGKVSLDNVNDFLKNTELLDTFDSTIVTPPRVQQETVIGFRNASFTWTRASSTSASERQQFRLTIRDELLFKSGCINVIVGPTGCGKTSVLMALLGEMHYTPMSGDSWFHFPREGGVAYAAQESWVQNDTIRNNILFGQPYDESRYKKVLTQTALNTDLELFEAGDSTEVGEKGLTLSGGQKARITLARAIYSQAKIILLDDILSSLDVHTSTWIVQACLKGDLVRGRTVILVTHHVSLVSPIAQLVVSLASDGTITIHGTDIEHALQEDPILATEVEREEHNADQSAPSRHEALTPLKEGALTAGKLIREEEVPKGQINRESTKFYFSSVGGRYPYIFFALWITGCIVSEGTKAFQKWFLGYWGSQYESHNPSEVNVAFYISIYCLIIVMTVTIENASYFFYLFGTIRASKKISGALVDSVLTGTLRWIDETPTARIITRFTQDIQAVDNALPLRVLVLMAYSIIILTNLVSVVVFSPIFLLPGILAVGTAVTFGRIYLPSQLSTKREQSNAKSPVLSHFSAAIAGIVSIRAYDARNSFNEEASKRIDKYTRISRTSYNLSRWISTQIDVLGDLFNGALAYYLVYRSTIGSANAGFSLSMATDLCSYVLWGVMFFNDFVIQTNSLERIYGYINIEHEPKATASGQPPAAWPTSGELVVERLCARYSRDGPMILKDVSFHVKSGERIGIVGRTGSGKSSLTLALLGCILTEGNIYFDGIPTSGINLDSLRSNMTIIPQMPELLSGTLRRNLDPFEQHDDATLNEALESAGLFLLQDEHGERRLTLDTNVASGGGNLSVGERQIIALARAMLRRSRVLILDEATSAIDHKTDSIIQSTLRDKLPKDVTVITVAHRLQTIMDADKIIVLDAGRLVEFDNPSVLLGKEDSIFKALVDGSVDREALYDMVKGGGSTVS